MTQEKQKPTPRPKGYEKFRAPIEKIFSHGHDGKATPEVDSDSYPFILVFSK